MGSEKRHRHQQHNELAKARQRRLASAKYRGEAIGSQIKRRKRRMAKSIDIIGNGSSKAGGETTAASNEKRHAHQHGIRSVVSKRKRNENINIENRVNMARSVMA